MDGAFGFRAEGVSRFNDTALVKLKRLKCQSVPLGIVPNVACPQVSHEFGTL